MAPLATIEAYRDHGVTGANLEKGTEQALYMLEMLGNAGVNTQAVALQLEQEGIQKIEALYQKLLEAIQQKIK